MAREGDFVAKFLDRGVTHLANLLLHRPILAQIALPILKTKKRGTKLLINKEMHLNCIRSSTKNTIRAAQSHRPVLFLRKEYPLVPKFTVLQLRIFKAYIL